MKPKRCPQLPPVVGQVAAWKEVLPQPWAMKGIPALAPGLRNAACETAALPIPGTQVRAQVQAGVPTPPDGDPWEQL